MRRIQPELFNAKVFRYLLPIDPTTKNDTRFEVTFQLNFFFFIAITVFRIHLKINSIKMDQLIRKIIVQRIYSELRLLDNYSTEVQDRIENITRIGELYSEILTRAPDTPYTTVILEDLWINNIMIKRGIHK